MDKPKRKRPSSPAHVRATTKYNKTHVIQYSLKLNVGTDEDMIAFLNSIENKNGYLKDLIRADMNKTPE